jgi:hypothetical protein
MPIPVPLIAAGIYAGGSLLSSLLGSSAAKRAASQQARSAQAALDLQRDLFGQTKAELSPYLQAGREGLSELSRRTLSGEFNKPFTAEMMAADPGLQYRMEQANLALERSSAARGRLLSGGTIKSIVQLNQALASQEYGAAYERNRTANMDEFNRLSTLSNTGLSAAGYLSGAREGFGTSASNLMTGIGAVQAGGTIGAAESQIGGIEGIMKALSDPAALKSLSTLFSGGGQHTAPQGQVLDPYMQPQQTQIGYG